jgi:hypothetical protein
MMIDVAHYEEVVTALGPICMITASLSLHRRSHVLIGRESAESAAPAMTDPDPEVWVLETMAYV